VFSVSIVRKEKEEKGHNMQIHMLRINGQNSEDHLSGSAHCCRLGYFPAITVLSLFPSVPPLCCELDIPQDMPKSSDLAANVKGPMGRPSNWD